MSITVQLPGGTARVSYACVPPQHSRTRDWATQIFSIVDETTGEDIFDSLSVDDFEMVEYQCERDIYEHSEAFA